MNTCPTKTCGFTTEKSSITEGVESKVEPQVEAYDWDGYKLRVSGNLGLARMEASRGGVKGEDV